jgi:hypothetical protein
MKTGTQVAAVLAVLVTSAVAARAEIIGGMNWADEVVGVTGNVQNNGWSATAQLLSDNHWWLIGAPDADVNGNGYAADAGVDQDSVAGWNGQTPGDPCSFTVGFDTAIEDLAGDDLKIVTYGAGLGQSTVSASSDGTNFIEIGTIGAGVGGPQYFDDLWFDFDGQIDDVHYVKIVRDIKGPQTGRFIDAVGGNIVPEPSTFVLLLISAVGLIYLRIRK